MEHPELNDRKKKIDFLNGLITGTRTIDELDDDYKIVKNESELNKAKTSGRYKTIFFIPDNSRN